MRILRVLVLALGLAAAGCGGPQSLALVGGAKVEAAAIDRDPLALLPSGILALGYLDAAAMFKTKWGPDVGRLIGHLLPLGPESGFVAERDVAQVYGGVYALQGADFCALVQGSFDVAAIRKAADARAITIAGAPLVKSRYADNDMFTAGNIGFVVLTSHTVLTGNETGMRRALDRLGVGKLTRAVPPWMVELAQTSKSALVVAGEPGTGPTVKAASQVVPFLVGVQQLRVLGNFEHPGLNVAGQLTYADAQGATNGAAGIQSAQRLALLASLFVSLGGLAIPAIQTTTKDRDVTFSIPVDESLLRTMLRLLTDATSTTVTSAGPPTNIAPRP